MLTPDRFNLHEHPAPFRIAPDPGVDVSVVIVSYNTRDITVQAVGSVLAHKGTLGIEVIVVDNTSTDGSAEAVRKAHPDVTVIDSGHNGGYGWGNNIGIAQARGRYVLVLNPDAVMHPDSLERAVAYMDKHSEVGILGAKVTYETGEQQSTLFRDLRLSHLMWRIVVPNRTIRETAQFGDQRYASRNRDQIQDVEVVAGCFMMLPRRVIEGAGAMDNRFFMYSEESEWCWRVRQIGYVVRYNPQITITHYGAAATKGDPVWKVVQIAQSHILYLRFTRGPFVAWIGTLLMWIGEVARGMASLGRGRAAVVIWWARIQLLSCALLRQPTGEVQPEETDTRVQITS